MAKAITAFLTKLDIKTPIEKMMNKIIPKWDQFSSKLETAGISAGDFQKNLTEVASEHGVSVDNLIQKYGSLGKVMSAGKISKNIIIETLKRFVDIEKSASAAATEITSKLETFNKVTREIINGDYGNGAARVKALTDAGYDYAVMQKLVNYVWKRNGKTWKDCNISADELTNAISGLSKEELKSIGYTVPDDYASYIVFTSGVAATELNYPDTIKWSGDDVIDGVFAPLSDHRYNVGLWYDGSCINAVARGVSV